MYIEEFIHLDGIAKIINMLRISDPAVVATCLRCLSYVFVYLNGVEYLTQRPHLFIKLFELINHSFPDIKKQILGIFIGLIKCMPGSYDSINKAAINNAKRNNRSPYAVLLNALSYNDSDLKINVLTFINWMMFKCPSEKKLAKFIARLENLGIYDEMRALAKERNAEIIN